MANTFSQVYLHLVFSTKSRADLISSQIEERVWAYMGGVAVHHGIMPMEIGGVDNHVHALLSTPTTVSPAQAAKYLKGDSSRWMRSEFPELRKFAWQDGYGAFSVSRSLVPTVVEYIKRQREHHGHRSFEDEFVELLRLHEVEYDERYLFG